MYNKTLIDKNLKCILNTSRYTFIYTLEDQHDVRALKFSQLQKKVQSKKLLPEIDSFFTDEVSETG